MYPYDYDPMMGTPPTMLPGQQYLPGPQQPMGMQPPAPQQGFGALATHPGMAGLSQAMNNIMGMRRGQAPTVSPFQAANEERRKNQVLQQRKMELIQRREQQKALETYRQATLDNQGKTIGMAQEQHDAQMDPFREYRLAIEQGIVPPDMSYKDFQQIAMRPSDRTSVQKNMEMWDQMNPNATPAERREAFAALARPTSIYDLGGGGKAAFNALAGQQAPIVSPEDATRREGELAAEKAGESKRASTLEEQAAGVRTTAAGLPIMDAQITRNNEIIQAIDDNGAYSGTGPMAGYVNRLFDPEVAALEAEGVFNALMNLQITRLTPVTEKELELVSKLWASAFRGGKVNKAILLEANRRIATMKDQAQSAIDYYNDDTITLPDGRIKPYGSMEGYKMGATRTIDLSGMPED